MVVACTNIDHSKGEGQIKTVGKLSMKRNAIVYSFLRSA
jgi:hypothetical protein